MTLVTLADACLRLPELIDLVARGERVVIVHNGVTLAALTPPPFTIPTPEEEARRRAAMEELSRQIAKWHEEDGLPFPPQDALLDRPQPESPAAEETAKIARREQLIREWLHLRPDAPLPIPNEMSFEDYFAQYQEQE